MKLPKPIKMLNLEKKGDLEKVKDEERDFVVLFHLGDIPWEKDAKQIFLSYAEKMANLLPQESKNRLETEVLSISFFPTIDDVYAEPCNIDTWNFALPFDKTPPKEECLSIKDEELKACCRESDIPFKDTFYGRIYTNMLKPKDIDNEDRVKTTGEELIEMAERLLFHVRLDIRSKAWEIAETENGMSDALRLIDWFNEFSSSFMAEIGKIACTKTDKEKQYFIEALKKQGILDREAKEKAEKELYNERKKSEKKEEDESEELLKKEPIWIKALCGKEEGFEKVLNYKLVRNNTILDLEFSFCSPKYNCGKLAKRIIEDDRKIERKYYEYKVRVEEKGFETRLKQLSLRLNDGRGGDVHNRLATSISKKKKIKIAL